MGDTPDTLNPSRRSVLRGLPLAAVAASLPSLAMPGKMTTEERIEHHLAELAKAVAEANPDMAVKPAMQVVHQDGGSRIVHVSVFGTTMTAIPSVAKWYVDYPVQDDVLPAGRGLAHGGRA